MGTVAHIVIVGDSGTLGTPLCEVLCRRGYRARMVADSSGMWRCVDSDAPDVIVLDLTSMPDGGLGLCRDVAARSGIPVIMLTAADDECARITALESGAADCLSRQFNPDELLARVGAVLRRTRVRWEDVLN